MIGRSLDPTGVDVQECEAEDAPLCSFNNKMSLKICFTQKVAFFDLFFRD